MHTLPSIILHHYTSGPGLLGIFGSDSVWATQIRYMNDSKEFAHAAELATAALGGLRTGRRGDKYAQLCAAVASHLESISGLALYVACFSEIHDSLSQWRGYCPPSFGYSIGFDGDLLLQIAGEQGFQLRPCIYDRDAQTQAVSEWARETLATLDAGCPVEADPIQYTSDHCNSFLQKFVAFAPYMKDLSFKDEREWRLVGLVPANDPRVSLRPGRSLLVPYVPVTLHSVTDRSPIWNVCVGPTPHIELAINSASHLFQKAKIRNGITRTMIPYRDW